MAKAKKTESSSTPKATKAAGAKRGGKAKSAAPASGAPQIDTSLAASTAAKLVAAKAAGMGGGLSALPSTGGSGKESTSFKNLKEGLAKPAASAMANLLDKAGGPNLPKSHHVPFGGPKQIGRNQTFGADVNRAGVPRRTGGG